MGYPPGPIIWPMCPIICGGPGGIPGRMPGGPPGPPLGGLGPEATTNKKIVNIQVILSSQPPRKPEISDIFCLNIPLLSKRSF